MPTKSAAARAAKACAPSRKGEPQPEDPSAGIDDAFTLWLQRHLLQSYGAIAAEPIPAELLRLFEDDEKARSPE